MTISGSASLVILASLIMWPSPSIAAPYDHEVQAFLGSDAAETEKAKTTLANAGSDGISALVRNLDGKDPKSKGWILGAIAGIREFNKSATIKDSDLIEISRVMRQEKDVVARRKAIAVFRGIPATNALKELERFASEDSDEWVRRDATLFAAESPTKEIQFLKKQTHDPSRWVRLTAFAALAESGDSSGRTLAQQTLQGQATNHEKQEAVWILGESGNAADSALLKGIAASSTADFKTKFMAAQAAKTIDLLQIPQSARLDYLIRSLDDPSSTVRHWASNKLGRSTDPLKVPKLKAYMSESGHKGYDEAMDALRGP